MADASLDVLLAWRGPATRVPYLGLASVNAVVVYYDTPAPPPPSEGQPDFGSGTVAGPSKVGACDAGGGVWVALPSPLSTRLTFTGDDHSFTVVHLSRVPSAKQLEVHLIVDYGGLSTTLNDRTDLVRVGSCAKDGVVYRDIRSGPASIETKPGKATKAAVVIRSDNFSTKPLDCSTAVPAQGPIDECLVSKQPPATVEVFLDFANLEEVQ